MHRSLCLWFGWKPQRFDREIPIYSNLEAKKDQVVEEGSSHTGNVDNVNIDTVTSDDNSDDPLNLDNKQSNEEEMSVWSILEDISAGASSKTFPNTMTISTSSELRDSTSLYRVPGAAAWPGLAAAARAKFKI